MIARIECSCNRTYSNVTNFNRHMRDPTSNFRCTRGCGRSFTRNEYRKRHEIERCIKKPRVGTRVNPGGPSQSVMHRLSPEKVSLSQRLGQAGYSLSNDFNSLFQFLTKFSGSKRLGLLRGNNFLELLLQRLELPWCQRLRIGFASEWKAAQGFWNRRRKESSPRATFR